MLKFARNRSSSAERHQSRFVQLQRTNTRDFSPARGGSSASNPGSPALSSLPSTPPSRSGSSSAGRSTSLERCRKQLLAYPSPRPRLVEPLARVEASGQSPPVVRTATVIPPIRVRLPTPSVSSTSSTDSGTSSSSSSNYTELSSGTLCRRPKATFAPMTPTLEKLTSAHVSEGVKPILPPKSVLKRNARYDFHKAVERLVEKLDLQLLDTSSESGYGSDDLDSLGSNPQSVAAVQAAVARRLRGESASPPPPLPRRKNPRVKRRVHFDSYVLLLQGIRERNLELVQAHVTEVCIEALATDEVMHEFMKAVIEGDELITAELLAHGANANFSDPTGLTPLHFAATFNNLPLIKLLLSHGAAIFARANSSGKTPAEMASPRLPNYPACHAYLRCMEECLGTANSGKVFVASPYRTCRNDELSCVESGEELAVLRKGDYAGSAWWWCAKLKANGGGEVEREEGYVLKDLLTLNKLTF